MSPRRPVSSKGEDGGRLTPYELRRAALGLRLRDLRLAARLNQSTMAERLGVDQSRVSKIENGVHVPTLRVLERIADALELAEEVREELRDQASELASVDVFTLRMMTRRGGQTAIQAMVGKREEEASDQAVFQTALIPGLLQTSAYMREMIATVAPQVTQVDVLVAGRVQRQRVLYDTTKRFRFLISESAFRARVTSAATMRGQLGMLARDAELPNIQVRALPHDVRLAAWAMTSFGVMDDTAEVELQAGEVIIREREVAVYRERFEALWRQGAPR